MCEHPSPIPFGSNDVQERADGTLWAHLPCAECGEYRVWEIQRGQN